MPPTRVQSPPTLPLSPPSQRLSVSPPPASFSSQCSPRGTPHQVVKGRLALVNPTVTGGEFVYEEGEDLEADEVEFHARNLPKTLAALPGGGLGPGATVEVTDQTQHFAARIVLNQRADWDEEQCPEAFTLTGEVPKPAADLPPPPPADGDDSGIELVHDDDDDVVVVVGDEGGLGPGAARGEVRGCGAVGEGGWVDSGEGDKPERAPCASEPMQSGTRFGVLWVEGDGFCARDVQSQRSIHRPLNWTPNSALCSR